MLLSFVDECYKTDTVFKNGFHRQVVMRELYVKMFQLEDPSTIRGNHSDLIAMTNKEGHWQCGPLPKRMKDYETFKIGDKFRLSWTEFVNQPRYMVEMQLEQAMKSMEAEAGELARQIKVIDDMIAKGTLDGSARDQMIAALKVKK